MVPVSPNEPKNERTGATDAHWIIRADPQFTKHEGGKIIVSGGTVYGDGYVIARAADVVRPYHVIVDVDDLKLVLGNQTVYSAEDDDLHQAICRLEAIAEGGTE